MVRSFDHVNHWAWEVAKHQRQRRAGLAEISYNLQGRNRNSSDDTANEAIGIKRKLSMNESEPTKRRRGRPRRITDTAAQNPILGAQSRPSPAFFATDQSQSSKLRRKSASPRKNARHIDQPRAPTSIDMPYLGRCNPRVKMKSFQEAKSAYKMPHSVLNLHTRLQNIPLGLIPGELKVGTRTQLSLSMSVSKLISRTLMRTMREPLANRKSHRDLSITFKAMHAPTPQPAYLL